MTDSTHDGAVPSDDAAIDDPPTVHHDADTYRRANHVTGTESGKSEEMREADVANGEGSGG